MAAFASDPALHFPSAGALLCSKYRLLRELGSGGMGVVWLARNEALGKDVAVKLLRADVEKNESDAAERFFREARAAASIDHPAIVRVFDCGRTESGEPFIVMERLRGASLSDVIERQQSISAIEAVRGALPIIDGLAMAHERGVVHRDLKPENVFLSLEAGQIYPKVLDFGIAKTRESDIDGHLTLNNTVVGSPVYMAPEQASGLTDVDHRCDIWAACVVIYEVVTGRAPFEADNYHAILASILMDEIPPFLEMPGEEGLWDVLSIGLRKEREERFQSMRELGDALAAFLVRHGVHDDIRGVPLATTWPRSGVRVSVPEPLPEPLPDSLPNSRSSVPVTVRAALGSLITTLRSPGAPPVVARASRTTAAMAFTGIAFVATLGFGYFFLESAPEAVLAPARIETSTGMQRAASLTTGDSRPVADRRVAVSVPAAAHPFADPPGSLSPLESDFRPPKTARANPKPSSGDVALSSTLGRRIPLPPPSLADLREPY